MTGRGTHTTDERLTLRSQLSELSQLPAWIQRLALEHAIPRDTQFAMNLCLEEILSNIIRHGYSGSPDRSIDIRFINPAEGHFVLVVEDEAPHFNPLDSPGLPAINTLNEERIGGQGIRLLRRFAETLEYQATVSGNPTEHGFLRRRFGHRDRLSGCAVLAILNPRGASGWRFGYNRGDAGNTREPLPAKTPSVSTAALYCRGRSDTRGQIHAGPFSGG